MEVFDTVSGQVLVGYWLLVNSVAFVVMVRDKRRAVRGHNAERAPEGFMFFLAAVFGSIGVLLGMVLCRHKIRKWYFQIGIPLLVLQNMATAYTIWRLLALFFA